MNEKQDLVCIFKGSAFEAEVVKARLESEGIPAMIMNNSLSAVMSLYSSCAGDIAVMVNPQDEIPARQLLEEL